jgi:predicted regulator of Ras-like GTPase activity (Roadblock/LC7/MglB family)
MTVPLVPTARAHSPFSDLLSALAHQRGVIGALVISERDGIVVDAQVHEGVRSSVIAALAASLYRRARQSADAAGLGTARYMELVAERGRLAMVGRGDLVFAVLAEPQTMAGRLRIDLLRCAERS